MLLRRVFCLQDAIRTTEQGVTLSLDPSDELQRALLYYGAYEPLTVDRMRKICEGARLVVDVGAHVGLFALTASRVIGPQGKVLAIEPNPRTFQRLLTNIEINQCSNLSPILGLASDSWEVVRMSWPPSSNWAVSRRSTIYQQTDYFAVAFPLSQYLSQAGHGCPDIVKLDVEGQELAVLKGLFMNSDMRPSSIIMEYLPNYFSNANEAIHLLAGKGYRLFDVQGTEYDCGHDLPESNLWARLL